MSTVATHLAAIVSAVGPPLEFNMPWHDCLMPVGENYHAIERAVNTAAVAGATTIWVVLDRSAAPIIKKKVGEWIYDPETIWDPFKPFLKKVQIPIYYISVQPKDIARRDSQGWGALYASKVIHYVSSKMSMWSAPSRYLFISPYGVSCEESILNSRTLLKGKKEIAYIFNNKNFQDNIHLPFTFAQSQYKLLQQHALDSFRGKEDRFRKISDVYAPLNVTDMEIVQLNSHIDISNWSGYREMMSGPEIKRPKYLVSHKWKGLLKDEPT
jgi:hypothetical protein